MRPTDPFDRHTASPTVLESRAGTLERLAAEAVDQQVVTDRAFDPAVAAWDGLAAGELQAAPQPLRDQTKDVAVRVAWTAVPLRAWADHVSSFNRKVDDLLDRRGRLPADRERRLRRQYPDFDEQSEASRTLLRLSVHSEMLGELEREWRDAFRRHVEEGEQEVVSMFTRGPTVANLAAARELGALPAGPTNDWFVTAWDRAAAVDEAQRLAGLLDDPSAPVTAAELEQLAAILDQWADDEEFSFLLLTGLGPDGFVELNAQVAVLGDEDADGRWARAVAAVQVGLAAALATATAQRGTGGTHEYDPYRPGQFELGPEWIAGLTRAGRELVAVHRLDGTVHEVYGYQLLGVLLGQGGFDDRFLEWIGTDLVDFEIAQGGSDLWLDVRQEGMRLNWIGGTGINSRAGFDPMVGLMEALAEHPEATRQILTSRVLPDGTPGELVRLDYLLTDREWPADLTSQQLLHYLIADTAPPASPGIAAFGRALEGATIVDPDERSYRIVEGIIYELATDEQAMGLPNGAPDDGFADIFRNTDIMHPDLRQSMANISDFYIQDLHWAVAGRPGDISSAVPYNGRLDLGSVDARHLQLFLADLGKDPGARDTVAAAEFAYAAQLLDEYYLDGWDGTGAAPDGVKGGVVDLTSRVIAALDVGASSAMRAGLAAEDAAYNDALRSRFFWIGLGISATDAIPVAGGSVDHVAGTVLDALEQHLRHDSTGRANYYHGDMKELQAQIMLDMVEHAVYESVTAELTPDEFLSRVDPADMDQLRVLIYPDDHPEAGQFVPMRKWNEVHHAAWGQFITASDNAGIHDLISDTRNRYENSLGAAGDSLEGDG
jgi:hypothetical protein